MTVVKRVGACCLHLLRVLFHPLIYNRGAPFESAKELLVFIYLDCDHIGTRLVRIFPSWPARHTVLSGIPPPNALYVKGALGGWGGVMSV